MNETHVVGNVMSWWMYFSAPSMSYYCKPVGWTVGVEEMRQKITEGVGG